MRASITFLILWFGFILTGFFCSFCFRMDNRIIDIIEIFFEHDIVYAMIIGWILSALIILYLYTQSTKKPENKEQEDVSLPKPEEVSKQENASN